MSDNKRSSARSSKSANGRKDGNGEKEPKRPPKTPKKDSRVKDEIYAILFLAMGIFFFIALHTNAAGVVGEKLKYGLLGLFGLIAYVISYILIIYSVMLFIKKAAHINARTLTLLAALILAIATINSERYLNDIEGIKITLGYLKEIFALSVDLENGGAVGMLIGFGLKKSLGTGGLFLVCISVILISLLLMSNTPISQALENFKERRAQKKLEKIAKNEEEDKYEQTYIPESDDYEEGDKSAIAAKIMNKRKIMEYMADDELFKEDQTSEEHLKDIESKFNAEVQKNPDVQKPKESFGARLNDATRTFIFGKKGLPAEQKPVEPVLPDLPDLPDEIEEIPGSSLEQDVDLPEDDIFYQLESNISDSQSEIPKVDEPLNQDTDEPSDQIADGTEDRQPDKIDHETPSSEPLTKTPESQVGGIARPYKLPSVNLLNKPAVRADNGKMDVSVKTALLEKTLKDFGVNAKILNVSRGPTVTRYEIQPGTGVKVSSIVRLSDDIALNLEAKSIRMEAPIPGKPAVGIEIENDKVQAVMIREVIDSANFKNHPSKISFAVGKDILGNAVVADLANMPHLLIAGSTGSGKSVCVNSIITSFLYRATPDEVRLLLVDPKVVELSVYNNIPHLLVPVVVDPGKAAAALHWAVQEMDDRYRKFAEFGVRKLEDYNAKVKGTEIETMPQVVIVIDELADLMMAAPSQVEASICRLAQKARAAGMHLIVATQRPSVDVITGVIKANIPSRIAFAVSSQIDSRTILDMAGAEKLVGKGDMLFNPLGQAKPVRVQGTFITDGEVEKVIEHVKSQMGEAPQEYSNDLIETIETTKVVQDQDENTDELLADAIEFVVNAEQASVSMLQRRFRVGYNRAARLIDMMEERDIVGPSDGSRPRMVKMSKEELADSN